MQDKFVTNSSINPHTNEIHHLSSKHIDNTMDSAKSANMYRKSVSILFQPASSWVYFQIYGQYQAGNAEEQGIEGVFEEISRGS